MLLKCILGLSSPVVTICTSVFKVENSAFCSHSVCLCSFVWVSEQTAIISLNITDLLFFYNRRSVHCAVRTESLNAIGILFLMRKG